MSARGGQGWTSRLSIGTLVVLSSLLALVALMALNWLAGRPGIRARRDLTRAEQNTLSTAARGVVERLRGTVTIDVLFRNEEYPLTEVARLAQGRTLRLLLTFRESSAGRIVVRQNDPTDSVAIEQRKRELRLRGFENCLVVSTGDGDALQREVLTLTRDLATFDPGKPPPDPRPATIVSFDAERAIVDAILKVTSGEVLDAYFTIGHGERDPFGDGPEGMGRLQSILADEGLRVGRWSPLEDGPLPEECACLTIVGPSDGFSDATLDEIEAWVRRGGRLVVAPHSDDGDMEQSRLGELTARFGIELLPGTVCQPHRDPATGAIGVGVPEVSAFFVHPDHIASHPMLEPIRRERRTFLLSGSHPVRLARQPEGGSASVLARSMPGVSWVERQDRFNWRPDDDEESGRRFDLGVASVFPAETDAPAAALEERVEARVVALGSSFAFTNQLHDYNADLLRNLYNWVLDREYRILISPRDPAIVRFAPQDAAKVAAVSRFAWGWLPAVCALFGILTGVWRAFGGVRRRRAA